MWLDNTNISENSYELTNSEMKIAKNFIEENKYLMQLNFNESIEENIKMLEMQNGLKIEDPFYRYFLAKKALVIMKENWARTLDETDKLNVNFYSFNQQIYSIPSKEQTQAMASQKEEASIQQQEDLNKAKILSEKIKNND